MTGPRRRLARLGVLTASLVADAATSLGTRRLQATLSAVGIGTGIAGVVLLVAVVSGLHRFALEHILSAGGNVIEVTVEPDRAVHDTRSLPATLRLGDETAVLLTSTYFDLASAENSVVVDVNTGERTAEGIEVRGVTRDGLSVLQLTLRRGRAFLPEELARGERTAILGAGAARTLFGTRSALGHRVLVGGWPFLVVGELDWIGDPDAGLRSTLDEILYVPFRSAAEALHGDDAIGTLRFRLRSMGTEEAAVLETRAVLDRQRRLRGETGGDLTVTNTVEQMRTFTRVMVSLRVLAAVVGAIGLIVGAVGVANVLVVSVRERTAEIGLRRACGATSRAIFVGLLLEAVTITLSGGLVGLLVAYSLSQLISLVPLVPVLARPHVSWSTSAIAFVGLLLVGLAAGVGPARRAARVYPAEALREAS